MASLDAVYYILGAADCGHLFRHIDRFERLGRNTHRIKPRLLKVEFISTSQAALVKKNSWMLAKIERFSRVYIKADESMETRNVKWQKRVQKRRNTLAEAAQGTQGATQTNQMTERTESTTLGLGGGRGTGNWASGNVGGQARNEGHPGMSMSTPSLEGMGTTANAAPIEGRDMEETENGTGNTSGNENLEGTPGR